MIRNLNFGFSIFALATTAAFADKPKDFSAVDAYIDNVNRIFALADEHPGNPGKVLADATIKTLDRKDTQYLTSLLMLDKEKMNLRWGRQDDRLMLVNIQDQKILGTLDVSDFDEKRTVSYEDKKINVLQFFEGGDLRTRTNRLVRAFDEINKSKQASAPWGFRFMYVAWDLITAPFRFDAAFALPPNVKQTSALGKALAANGPDCQNVKSVNYTVRSFACPQPREAVTAANIDQIKQGYQYKGQTYDNHGRSVDSNGNPKWKQ